MRTVGQKDPLLEFKHESFALFDAFSKRLRLEISRDLFRFEMLPPQEQRLEQTAARLQRKQRSKPLLPPLSAIDEAPAIEP
jgi:preprotein translocase subunit SecA